MTELKESVETLLKMRDLINEMEPGFNFKENVDLCYDRLSDMIVTMVFSGEKNVVNGEILKHKYTKNELRAMGRVGEVVDVDDE